MPKKKPQDGRPQARSAPPGAHRITNHDLILKQNRESREHRWWAQCSCGYHSTTRVDSEGALEAAVHHVKQMRVKRLADGMPNERASIKVS